MSQEKLGEAVDITFQQIQKYECGANRISASRLYDISRVLEVPVGWFFDDLPEDLSTTPSSGGNGQRDHGEDLLTKRETLDFVRAYYQIDDLQARKRVYELVKAIASSKESREE